MSEIFNPVTETFIIQLMLLIWIVSEIVGMSIIPRLRRGRSVITRKDRGSSLIIFATIFLAIIITNYFANYSIATLPGWVFLIGVMLMILGIFLRQLSMIILGRFFSGAVGTQEGQVVVEKGPYKYVRHPSYTGALFILIGLGLAAQSGGAVVAMIILFSIAYGYRMYIEEKVLVNELGNDYIAYKKRTKRLIPYIV